MSVQIFQFFLLLDWLKQSIIKKFIIIIAD